MHQLDPQHILEDLSWKVFLALTLTTQLGRERKDFRCNCYMGSCQSQAEWNSFEMSQILKKVSGVQIPRCPPYLDVY